MSHLIRNAIKTPDGTILESRHRHDFVSHTDKKTGTSYFVDGGLDYCRRGYDNRDFEDLSLHSDAPFKEIREGFSWGTYGKSGKAKLKYVLLKNMDADHILAIIRDHNKTGIYKEHIIKIFKDEIEYRQYNTVLI